VADVLERAVHDEGSEIPPGLNGLSSIDARRLLGEVGPNRWVKQDRFARVREVVSLVLDPMAVMLIIAAVVYFLLGETRDAVVLALALIPVLGVDVVLEARSRAALEKLARAAAPFADVVRDRHVMSVPLEDVVPGDLLVLREGHVIAADGVVRWAANVAIDESSLTGESEPQVKTRMAIHSGRTLQRTRDSLPDLRWWPVMGSAGGHDRRGDPVRRHRRSRGAKRLFSQSAAAEGGHPRSAASVSVAVIVAIALFGLSPRTR
jgi:magnesium-transporting ATPase (P-type)